MTKTRDLANLGGGFIQDGTGAMQRTVEQFRLYFINRDLISTAPPNNS